MDSTIAATTLNLTVDESVEIRTDTPELLEVEVTYGPGGEPPPKHLHPSQDEHFEVIEGSVRAKIGGEEREYGSGDRFDIPRRVSHQFWNPSSVPVRIRWQVRPALRTREWFEQLDRIQREGKTTKDGGPKPTAIGPLLVKYRDVFRLALR